MVAGNFSLSASLGLLPGRKGHIPFTCKSLASGFSEVLVDYTTCKPDLFLPENSQVLYPFYWLKLQDSLKQQQKTLVLSFSSEQVTGQGKISANRVRDRQFVSRMYKEFSDLTVRRQTAP